MNKEKLPKIFCYLILFLIAFASLYPALTVKDVQIASDLSFRLDYIFHFLVYCLLGVSLLLWKGGPGSKFRNYLFIFTFGIIYSSIFEMIQYFLPSRTMNPFDMLSNFLGFITGSLLGYLFLALKNAPVFSE